MATGARDLLPNTPTARALKGAGADPEATPIEAATCKPKRYVTADPDAPNAPTCKPGRYVIADPDAPDAPTCKPGRYIVAPEPKKLDRERLPAWAKNLGEDLAERF